MSSKRKTNKTGRGSNALSDFIALERYLISSLAYRSLKPVARSAYVEVCYCFEGTNNGRIQMAVRTLGERLGVDKATAARALQELVAKGFIEVTKQSAFSVKSKQCSEYRITAFSCAVTGDLPSKNFMRWQPEIQNTVAPAQLHGCTHATDGQKTTRNSPLQLPQRDREAPKQPIHGCTSAPLLYSTILPQFQNTPSKLSPSTTFITGTAPIKSITELDTRLPDHLRSRVALSKPTSNQNLPKAA